MESSFTKCHFQKRYIQDLLLIEAVEPGEIVYVVESLIFLSDSII